MKANCKDCAKQECPWNGANIEKHNSDCFIPMTTTIPTASLLAELEKRRPCKRCEFKLDEYCECCWDGLNSKQDNFKPAK